MLKRFEIQNFKNFKDKLVFDLMARDYSFNNNLVNNGIVNKALVYGKNGIGKSNLGIAIFDIVLNLTDKERFQPKYLDNYLNLDSKEKNALFKYIFQFGSDEVVYEYEKKNPFSIIYERILVNKKEVLIYDFLNPNRRKIDSDLKGDLNINLIDNRLSIVKYIYRNSPTNENSIIFKLCRFVEKMLWYRGLSDGNTYCGYTNGNYTLEEKLYESGKLEQFENFLKQNDMNYKLSFDIGEGSRHVLYANFENGKRAPLAHILSTGTNSLFLFYIWKITSFNDISFLFIDEFDAFFHFEAAENIVKTLNENINFQSIVTSHNTYLMQNSLTRPDCCFIMTDNKITSLANSTKKEIREAHNLEKMYINGAFVE